MENEFFNYWDIRDNIFNYFILIYINRNQFFELYIKIHFVPSGKKEFYIQIRIPFQLLIELF